MKGIVYNNSILAGYLEKDVQGNYIFDYEDAYFNNPKNPPISLTLPKNQKSYYSTKLFAFFYGMLSEGLNKEIQCRLYKIDENDDFTRLLLTFKEETIGAITIKPEDDELFRLL